MAPWYIAIEKFGPAQGERWIDYVKWSGLHQLEELISLDTTLCPSLLPEIKHDDWPHIVNEDGLLHFFIHLAYLRNEVAGINGGHILCVYRNPARQPVLPDELNSFQLAGYDLVDKQTGVSALSNCGGWPGILDNSEITSKGLIESHGRAVKLKEVLALQYPEEPHAQCDVWAIFVEQA